VSPEPTLTNCTRSSFWIVPDITKAPFFSGRASSM